ncbi:EamA family transporter [Vibrio fluvialis]|uniref:EamA family transporter n=1 Tax=Vibrio fluvialis TaxID=676 RepID=UPI001C9D5B7D|nr:EamA family transporter [Vibrio fluvialis]MBY7783169.1 EamA family transporter [Vibrio fluvialis]MBY7854799.1 EamA family transporter [Vibrio fluvialis]MBY7858718.1 EamA family transporter [Vibrio fluvialis]MBY7901780.1 EamA family transporter [Vibrio fluvialis]MBY7924267.1 EamA family transporter [Vibrio fluvialis]
MTLFNVLLILVCVFGISVGQILFKLASPYFPQVLSTNSLIGFLFNKYLFSALIIYGFATILWVYALRLVPLSIAYPFMALAFVIVPILGAIFLNESFQWNTLIGAGLIMIGLLVIVR